MNQCALTVVDTTSIQNYIFGSNELRENVGASELVELATKDWVFETLYSRWRVNVVKNADGRWQIDHSLTLESDELDAEVLYAGGGNTVILFADHKQAPAWSRAWSLNVLREAPGLNVVVAHSEPFAWRPDQHDLPDRVHDLIETSLAQAKQSRTPSTPLLGLGVTATCQSTGLVAVDVIPIADDEQRVSREASAKAHTNSLAKRRFDQMFPAFAQLGVLLPDDFDHLGRSKGEQSHIAVVHADGNGMGERFKQVGAVSRSNRDYIQRVRRLSEQINDAGIAALNEMLAPMIGSDERIKKSIPHFQDTKKAETYLPFRPLVYGGDDVTFVCDGRLGLPLAARYLRAFEVTTEQRIGESVRACAGIAIVKTHYPFARAYALSETLCANAKRWVHEVQGEDFSALDWHIAMSGLLGKLGEIRRREYTVPRGADTKLPNGGSLTMRPVRLHPTEHEWRVWPAFEKIVREFQTKDTWAGKRNKIMQLREVLRAGPSKTHQFLKLYPADDLPIYPHASSSLHLEGWSSEMCGYFDPIEALDFYPEEVLEVFV